VAASPALRVALGLILALAAGVAPARPWTPDSGSRLDRTAVAAILAEFSGDQRKALGDYRDLLREDPSLVFAADALRELVLEAGSREALRALGPWTLEYRPEDTELLGLWLEELLASRSHDTLDDALSRLAPDLFPDLRLRRRLAEGEGEAAWLQLESLPDWQALSDEDWLYLLEWRQRNDRPLVDPARRLALDWLEDTDRRGQRELFDQGLATLPPEEGAHLRVRQELLAGRLDQAWSRLEDLLTGPGSAEDAYGSLMLWVRLSGHQAGQDSSAARKPVERALDLLARSPLRATDAAVHLAEARLLWLIDRSGPALAAIDTSLERDSLMVDALVLRGHIHLALEQWMPASLAFEKAARLVPGHPEILDPYCYTLQRLGFPDRALPLRALLVENFPGQQSFWIDYANLLLELGHREQSLDAGLAAIEAFGASARPMLLNNTAYLMAQLGRDPRRAEALARQALQGEPQSPFYLDTLGWILLLQGRLDEAAELLERAHRQRPEDGEILLHLGELYLARGDRAAAREAWQKALATQPENPDLRERLESLDRLPGTP
jgi:tetratricopeptide (TPR) repeat protein